MNFQRLSRVYALQYTSALKTLQTEKETLSGERRRVSDAKCAQRILQEIASTIQESVHKQISTLVTKCLCAVFDDPYRFKIKFEKKRGKTEAKLVFLRRGLELDPIDGCGGGVLDVAAFALRLACLLIQRPRRRKVLILDEAFRFVSERKEYRHRVRELLETLAKEMKVQLILVTHDPILEVGKVVELD